MISVIGVTASVVIILSLLMGFVAVFAFPFFSIFMGLIFTAISTKSFFGEPPPAYPPAKAT